MLTARKSGGSTFDALRLKPTTKKRNNVYFLQKLDVLWESSCVAE